MINVVVKFVFPVTVTSVGGATILGATSNGQNHPNTVSAIVKSSSQEKVGNCQVINGKEEIINKLPSEHTYVSFSCQNIGGEESVLNKWSGFFPETLLKGGSKDFPLDKKFSIEVHEEDNEDLNDREDAIYKTTFTSQEFSNSSRIIGKWSTAVVEDTDDEDVYKVRLDDKPNSVDYAYLTYHI